jgi:hypothetical protein
MLAARGHPLERQLAAVERALHVDWKLLSNSSSVTSPKGLTSATVALRTGGAEGKRDRLADAGRGAGDDRDLALELKTHSNQ